jgi:hypothetical protein
MKKRGLKKLMLSRETLHRLEENRLHEVARGAGGGVNMPCPESVSWCITQLCISEGYTGCAACEEWA